MWILIGYNQIIQVAKKLTRSINKLYDFIQLKTSSLPFNFLSLRITPRKIRLPKHKVAQDHILADKKTQTSIKLFWDSSSNRSRFWEERKVKKANKTGINK